MSDQNCPREIIKTTKALARARRATNGHTGATERDRRRVRRKAAKSIAPSGLLDGMKSIRRTFINALCELHRSPNEEIRRALAEIQLVIAAIEADMAERGAEERAAAKARMLDRLRKNPP
jgi:cob(I)alamin adenosyltransferase